jgi:hypothetical protein
MRKRYRHIILFSVFLCTLSFINGQGNSHFGDTLSRKFKEYCDAFQREEIYIHTDRMEYIAGENIWVNIFLVDRQKNIPSPDSKIAYFEILNSENRPVVQKRIWLKNGSGPGHIILPDTLSTGKYTLRTYTNRMKNFLPLNCFSKKLNIYNAISDKTLKGDLNSGAISSGDNEEINLSVTSNMGLSLGVDNFKPDVLEILIYADDNFRSRNNNSCYLFIHTRGEINLVRTLKLQSGETRVELPKNNLTPGINQITIFDSFGLPVLERFIYTPIADPHFLTINCSDSFKIRDKVSVDFEFDEAIISSLENADFSISVAPVTENMSIDDMSDYMVFGSEFGIIPDVIRDSRLDELSPEIIDDFLLTVKSNWIDWDVILSESFPPLRYKVENKDHLLTGRLLSKNSTDNISNKCLFLSTPAKAASFRFSRTDKEGRFSFNIPINEEIRDLIIQPEEINDNIIIRLDSPFAEEYLPAESVSAGPNIHIPEYISDWSVNYQVNRIYESVFIGEPLYPLETSMQLKRFYGKPDIEILMDDYIQLPVMPEVFFELTPGVFLKNKKFDYTLSIADPVDNKIYEKPPILFIDGVVINDPGIIASLDPEIVEKIDVVKSLYLVGDYMFFGLVNVITRAGDYSSVALPDYAVRFKYRVIDPVMTFLPPDYSETELKNSRIPDFRNTLYWNPSVTPDKEGKARIEFWTSDVPGDYEINMQGISSTGNQVSITKIIKVK